MNSEKHICDYGCGQEAKHQFKNGKWCCSKSHRSCPTQRTIHSIKVKNKWKDPNSKLNLISKETRSNIMKKLWKNPDSAYNSVIYREKVSRASKKAWEDPNSKLNSILYKEKQKHNVEKEWKNPNSGLNSNLCKEKKSNGMIEKWEDLDSIYNSTLYRNKRSTIMKKAWKNQDSVFSPILFRERMRFTIEKINKKYHLFSKIEEMRYNPDKPLEEKEIQVHCKNHNCKNSKEKDGWFTPSGRQISNRIQAIENTKGFEESNFYCSQKCKDSCLLYNTKGDLYRSNNKPYTYIELQTYNKFVLERDNNICHYCGKDATVVHHLRSQKIEPFFALDPDYAVSCCKKCHYKYGHPTGGKHSTGNIAKIVCSTESQKFINQK